MQILLFSDLHCSSRALAWLSDILSQRKIDLVIGPGDIVDRHVAAGSEYVDALINVCVQANVPLKVVFGNNESDEIIGYYERRGISLHNKSFDLGGYTFVGIGDIEVHPDRMIDPSDLPIDDNILVTHRPPSQLIVSKFKNAPTVHITGHLHSNGFVKQIGKTLMVNVPAALNGGAAILQLPQKSVQFIKEHD